MLCVKPWSYRGCLPHEACRLSGASQSRHHSLPCSLQRKCLLLSLLVRVQAPEQPYSGAYLSEPQFLHCHVGIMLPASQECKGGSGGMVLKAWWSAPPSPLPPASFLHPQHTHPALCPVLAFGSYKRPVQQVTFKPSLPYTSPPPARCTPSLFSARQAASGFQRANPCLPLWLECCPIPSLSRRLPVGRCRPA